MIQKNLLPDLQYLLPYIKKSATLFKTTQEKLKENLLN